MDFIVDAKKNDAPFFVYLATPAAHEPVWAKERDAEPYEGVAGLPHAGFYGMIANIDENLGRLVRFLEDQQLAERYDPDLLERQRHRGGRPGLQCRHAWVQGIAV